MGTPSVIARDEQHTTKGRYVHWDGHPISVGAALIKIVNRDGIETARRVLTEEHFGWSSVNAEDEQDAQRETDRFEPVPGYGVAYTHTEHLDDWAEDVDGQAYGYVLTDEGLRVIEDDRTTTISWDDAKAADLLAAFQKGR